MDLGLMLAEPDFHTRCYVEWEKKPREALIAAMGEGYFEPAPIWDDVTTFDGKPFRGAIDTILAGYPCQPFSQAGQRKGEDDERHLWPDIARVIREVQPAWVILENVAGHVTLGAETVLRELHKMGFKVASGLFTAAETGSTHKRERWFCVAYSDSNSQQFANRKRISEPNWRNNAFGCGREIMGHPTSEQDNGKRRDQKRQRGFVVGSRETSFSDNRKANSNNIDRYGRDLDNPERDGRAARRNGDNRGDVGQQPNTASGATANAQVSIKWSEYKPSCAGRRRAGFTRSSAELADTSDKGFQGRERDGQTGTPQPSNGHPTKRSGTVADTIRYAGYEGGHRSSAGMYGQRKTDSLGAYRQNIHPPGPNDANAWAEIIRLAPDLAPATSFGDAISFANHQAQMVAQGQLAETEAKRRVCRMVDGLAGRSRALKLLGNGVHPLGAANAISTLFHAHGLGRVYVGAARDRTGNKAREFI
ncbi:MAG: DNA cytosine methyltransferase [Rhodobacteraceae bacterium]|nr:DNA cytosine methyltransferase [Paracoccaceae bacterium]